MSDITPDTQRGSALEELQRDDHSRQRFLRGLGSASAVGAFGVLLAACGSDKKKSDSSSSGGSSSTSSSSSSASTSTSASSGGSKGDIEIVNYALTLEYLEADFYQQVIDSGLVKDPKIASLAKSIGQNEQEHVDALTATVKKLGGKPATKPKTKFEPVLQKGLKEVLMTAATVENLGASAYLGQAGNIKDKEILAAALAIHTVEARHAAALNSLVGRGFKGDGALSGSVPDGAFAKPMSMDEVLKQVKPFIAS
jgi:rubrerythrin